MLTYLNRKDIDTRKWDDCIMRSTNSLIYSRSLYLDAMADDWDALIIGHYEAVMPLPFRKKYGIKYFYQPAFTQQLGLFGNNDQDVKDLLKAITAAAKYGDIKFNYSNQFVSGLDGVKSLTNLVLDLKNGYETISNNYKKPLLSDLKKAEQLFQFNETDDIRECIELYKRQYEKRIDSIKKEDYNNFYKICNVMNKNDQCFCYHVRDQKHILAAGLLIKDERRVYNLVNVITDEGKRTSANRLLFDRMIRKFAGQNLVFDFEGSEVPGIKKFYQRFGAIEQPYFLWHFNNLPAVIKAFKK